MQKKILFVCLGNICRSPAAEAVFLHLIKKKGLAGQFFVDSAGTGGWHVGHKADGRMIKAAQKRGIQIDSIARQIHLDDLESFDVILAMDNDNLESLNSFSQEFGTQDSQTIKLILDYARNTNLIEVPDPYYGGETGFEKVLDLLEDACDGLLEQLILKE
ncbi:low molecular weight protein-tyrosine-phosphatase [Prochlorococcus sp. MIT 1307]|uniref:low molecular weight protein-tyrosine-phosphatase n=1 Tax=Prochlorococcus sp. MIT 1307 TaxID=3096219 RepID=UPI002A751D65|nr:low molecular weight protein-tyrosine-phosphatase [Prochlorococcus sp. MIT 1307]